MSRSIGDSAAFRDARLFVALLQVVATQLAARPLPRDAIVRALRARLVEGDLDLQGVDALTLAAYLVDRLSASGVLRFDASGLGHLMLAPHYFFPDRLYAEGSSGDEICASLERAVARQTESSAAPVRTRALVLKSFAADLGDLRRRDLGALTGTDTEPGAAAVEGRSNYIVRTVFYATNRRRRGDGTYGGQTSRTGLVLGRCEVSIPKQHLIGKEERPNILRFEFREDPEKHITVQRIDELDPDTFYQRVRSTANAAAFVFIHGYKVTFATAVRRTAQMAHDLQFAGAAITFSWPSKGNAFGYWADEEAVQLAQPHLTAFLLELAAKAGLRTIHVVAHSMGARALTQSLRELVMNPAAPQLSNVVFAAPDVNRELFLLAAPAIAKQAKTVTLYVSANDAALRFSKTMHSFARAGECGEVVIHPPIATIDVSALDTDFFGHGYVTSARTLLSDLHDSLHGELPPRFGLEEVPTPAGSYWRFIGS